MAKRSKESEMEELEKADEPEALPVKDEVRLIHKR
jgi:hypothetical protein